MGRVTGLTFAEGCDLLIQCKICVQLAILGVCLCDHVCIRVCGKLGITPLTQPLAYRFFPYSFMCVQVGSFCTEQESLRVFWQSPC